MTPGPPLGFISLLDNYETSTGTAETVTAQEQEENRLFLDAIMETDVMKVRRGQTALRLDSLSVAEG